MKDAAASKPLMPTMGEWRGRVHHYPVRVYYEDTYAAGIVYHANYLRFAERGRTEMIRTMGVEQDRMRAETGLVFVLREGDVKFRSPARLDDALIVESALMEMGAASIMARQIIRRADADQEEMVRFNAQLALTGRDGKPARIPPALRAKFEAYLNET